jgi:hypothetical protein
MTKSNQQENLDSWTPARLAKVGVWVVPEYDKKKCVGWRCNDLEHNSLSLHQNWDGAYATAIGIAKEREGAKKVYELTLSGDMPIEVGEAPPGNCPEPCFQLIGSRIVGETPEDELEALYALGIYNNSAPQYKELAKKLYARLKPTSVAIAAARKGGE